MAVSPHFIAVLLLVLCASTMALVFLFCYSNHWLRKKLKTVEAVRGELAAPEKSSLPSFLIDRPARWIAIKSSNLPAVQAALHLDHGTPCCWTEGFAKNADTRLFISPPVDGWTVVLGQALPEPADDIDRFFRFALKLSRDLGQVQFFSSSRFLSHHAWVRADEGRIIRAYVWAGQTLWNQGKVTFAEQQLGLKCFPYGVPGEVTLAEREAAPANCEKVMLLASKWSLDPVAIADQNLKNSTGIAGDPASDLLKG